MANLNTVFKSFAISLMMLGLLIIPADARWKAPTQSGLAEKTYYGATEEVLKKIIIASFMQIGFSIDVNQPSVLIVKQSNQGSTGSYLSIHFNFLEGNGKTFVTMVNKSINPNANSISAGLTYMPQELTLDGKQTFESNMEVLQKIQNSLDALKEAEAQHEAARDIYVSEMQRKMHNQGYQYHSP